MHCLLLPPGRYEEPGWPVLRKGLGVSVVGREQRWASIGGLRSLYREPVWRFAGAAMLG